MCLPALTAVSASALQSFTCVLASLCICLHLACAFVSLCLHLSPSSGLLWPPLPCNPLSPSSGRRRLQSVPIRKTQTVWGLRWCNLSPRLFLVVGFRARLSPTCFHVSPNSFHLSPRLGACGRVPGWLVSHSLSFVSQFFSFVSQGGRWVLVVGFQAGLSPTSFHLSQFFSFVSQAGGFPAGLSPTSFHLSPSAFHLSPRLVACGRVPGWLVSHFLSCVPHFFSFVFQFLSFVSQAGCLRSGSRLACLQLAFICLPVLFICLPGGVLVVGFLCLPLLFICLPGWVLVVGFLASLSPTCFHLSPTSFHLSPRLGACGRVPGWLVSHFLSCVSQFFSFVSQAGCLWSG